MDRTRRDCITSLVLLPLVLVAAGVLAYVTIRTNLQVDKLGQQSMLEATLGLANEKADRLDKHIVEEDNVVFAIADPATLSDLSERWLPTAQRETPTVRAILVLSDAHEVLAFASRAGGAFWDEEAFRRLLVTRMIADMEPRRASRVTRRDPRWASSVTCTTRTAARATSSATGSGCTGGGGTSSSRGTTSGAS